MNRKLLVTTFAVPLLAILACNPLGSVVDKVTGGDGNMRTVSQLWSDVPRMDGMTPSDMDMPLPIKLVMRTVIGNLGLLNKEGEDRTTGNIDWIVFTSAKTPTDVQNFYTNQRMKASGWEVSKESTCVSGSEQGMAQVGVLCGFVKQSGNQETGLLIIAAPDDQTKETDVFFLRLEVAGTPTPKK